MVIGTMVTLSRAGFLGLVACVGAMVWYSKNRLKFIAAMLGLSVVLLPLAYVAVPDRYIAEIASIGDSSDGTRQNRLYFWKYGLMMYQANPVLGVGGWQLPVDGRHLRTATAVKPGIPRPVQRWSRCALGIFHPVA